jgi:hypothetical protein
VLDLGHSVPGTVPLSVLSPALNLTSFALSASFVQKGAGGRAIHKLRQLHNGFCRSLSDVSHKQRRVSLHAAQAAAAAAAAAAAVHMYVCVYMCHTGSRRVTWCV